MILNALSRSPWFPAGLLLMLCALPPAAWAQGTWEVPEGSEIDPVGPPHEFPSLTGEAVGPILFTEPEFPPATIVDGLVVTTVDGNPLPAPLSFGFTLGGMPSVDCTINVGPPPQMYVDPPGIEGNIDGTLSIDFGTDVSSVEFGFAVACLPPPVNQAATITAFDASMNPVGSMSFDAVDTGNIFVESLALFSAGSFRSIEVTWADPICGRFFLDNLSYEEAALATIEVPTLGTAGLLALAAVLLLTAIFFLRWRVRA